MLDEYYLYLNIGTIVFTYIIARLTKVHVQWSSYLRALVLVSLPFIIWDAWAVSAGHWSFNPDFTMGRYVGNLAVEEIMFFISVPYAMTVIYLLGKRYTHGTLSEQLYRTLITILFIVGVAMFITAEPGTYTYVNALAFLGALTLLLTTFKQLSRTMWFWQFQLILYALFLIFNTVLTAPPVIKYGAGEYIGIRVGTIPIEDFFYNFTLANLFIAVYTQSMKTSKK